MKRLSELREKVIFNRNGIKARLFNVCGIINPYQKMTISVLHCKLMSLDSHDPSKCSEATCEASYHFKDSHEVLLGMSVFYIPWEQSLTRQGSNVPAEAGVAQPDNLPGSVLDSEITHISLTHCCTVDENPPWCAFPFCISCSQSDS